MPTPEEIVEDLQAKLAKAYEVIGRLHLELVHKREVKAYQMAAYRANKGKPPLSAEERKKAAANREVLKRERNDWLKAKRIASLTNRVKFTMADGGEFTTFDIASELDIPQREISRNISHLISDGYITRTRYGISQSGQRQGYYQITEKGREGILCPPQSQP